MSQIDFLKMLENKSHQVVSVRDFEENDLKYSSRMPIRVSNSDEEKLLTVKILSPDELNKYRNNSGSTGSIKFEVNKSDEGIKMRKLGSKELKNYERDSKTRRDRRPSRGSISTKAYRVKRLNSLKPEEVVNVVHADEKTLTAYPENKNLKSSLKKRTSKDVESNLNILEKSVRVLSVLHRIRRRKSSQIDERLLKKRVSFVPEANQVKFFDKHKAIESKNHKKHKPKKNSSRKSSQISLIGNPVHFKD